MKKAFAAAGVGVALAAASPAIAQSEPTAAPIRVGILAADAGGLIFDDANTRILYREFAPSGAKAMSTTAESERGQGQTVMSAFVKQVRRIDQNRPIEIFAANAYYSNHSDVAGRSSVAGSKQSLDAEGARRAIHWFKANDVRVVVATIANNAAGMRSLMQEARDQGMIVFAGVQNHSDAGRAFSRAYPEAISVMADNPGLALRDHPGSGEWATFAMDGSVPLGPKDGDVIRASSSFAAAKAAAFGAFALATGQAHDRESVVGYMRDFAENRSYRHNVMVHYLDEREAAFSAQETAACHSEAIQVRAEERKAAGAERLRHASRGPGDRGEAVAVQNMTRGTGAGR